MYLAQAKTNFSSSLDPSHLRLHEPSSTSPGAALSADWELAPQPTTFPHKVRQCL